ncbi:Eukaryotic initiation factor 4A-II [Takifugu flavidus]|uniref:Eukaryotic initiation factor 4A-II n=1 Tax=Takifugu flavidus TaxID=433684 RepID=A0A5C6PDI1_9TELE|nr:Eukaryotic initiation factor 4A-II [Takifugu flavidus]
MVEWSNSFIYRGKHTKNMRAALPGHPKQQGTEAVLQDRRRLPSPGLPVSPHPEALPLDCSFEELELRENPLRGVSTYGFEKPSLAQRRAVVPYIKGYDVITQSHCGETATYISFILQRINANRRETQAIIQAPSWGLP